MRPSEVPEGGMLAVQHGKITLALHLLRAGEGRPLLLLHGLGEATPHRPPAAADAWPGPVWGLDFTGHGASTVPTGGGYTAEVLMADVDAALGVLGEATLLGRGLGAYVALLTAGARPTLVRGAILADGVGLAGGGSAPGSPSPVSPVGAPGRAPDPFALAELTRDVRPPDYATSYVQQALQLSGLDLPITVSAVIRPDWLAAVVATPGVCELDLAAALASYAA